MYLKEPPLNGFIAINLVHSSMSGKLSIPMVFEVVRFASSNISSQVLRTKSTISLEVCSAVSDTYWTILGGHEPESIECDVLIESIEMKVIEQCQNTLDAWTKSGVQSPFSITMNVPEIWTCAKGVTNAIIEPFIPNFTKFNSNSGWILDTDSERGHILQALSHFSYHISGGQLLLCDLQGGFERDRHCLVWLVYHLNNV